MSGNPPVCNALHTPIAGEIDCADWEANEANEGGLTPDGLYLRERLDQGQVPIAEIIQRQRSEQVERWREAFERGDPFGDLPEITHDPRGNLRTDRSEAMMFGYEIQESIEARRAAIARDTQRQADENESLREYYRIDQRSPAIAPPLTLTTLYRLIRSLPTPTELGHRHQVHSMRSETVDFVTIATPNGLKWQYQGAVIID